MSFDFTTTCEELLSLPLLSSFDLHLEVLTALSDANSEAEMLDFLEFLLGRIADKSSFCASELELVRTRIETCSSQIKRNETLETLELIIAAHGETILLNHCIEKLCDLSIGHRLIGFTQSFMRELKEAQSAQANEIKSLMSSCDNIDN